MTEWQDIATAPKTGEAIRVKRVYQGQKLFEGQAAWRTVRFNALSDPLTGLQLADEEMATGWMYANVDKRFPEPTHWMST